MEWTTSVFLLNVSAPYNDDSSNEGSSDDYSSDEEEDYLYWNGSSGG